MLTSTMIPPHYAHTHTHTVNHFALDINTSRCDWSSRDTDHVKAKQGAVVLTIKEEELGG